ncbi:DUF1326 domain-containing protein [Candidatus Nitrososphaera evergladensis]|uniref:DUF1326 domain-containing protein n=1 Tax=Candidatus Nitrososphaera evergladensis TaxID=1459637 RepID=UPI00130D4F7F|nr:DUF1326 domain-containing protein [Candidatus Nitrososphaera evergladensis]
MSAPQSWKIEGDYFEACNCDVVCPCVFMGDPDRGECDVTVAWHIQKGNFGNTRLDGLNVVAVFHAPGNMFTGPKWKAALYLDERANKDQADALVKIYSGQAGGFFGVAAGFIGDMAGVRSVPIKFEADGRKRSLQIPSAMDVAIEGIASGEGQNKETTIENVPMTVAPGFPAVVAKSVKHSYSDHGMKWDNSGKNGFYSKFAYSP